MRYIASRGVDGELCSSFCDIMCIHILSIYLQVGVAYLGVGSAVGVGGQGLEHGQQRRHHIPAHLHTQSTGGGLEAHSPPPHNTRQIGHKKRVTCACRSSFRRLSSSVDVSTDMTATAPPFSSPLTSEAGSSDTTRSTACVCLNHSHKETTGGQKKPVPCKRSLLPSFDKQDASPEGLRRRYLPVVALVSERCTQQTQRGIQQSDPCTCMRQRRADPAVGV